MHVLEVGKPYIAGRTNWPERVEYNYRSGEHELRLFLRSPSREEVEAVRSGGCEFGVAIERPVIFFLYCLPPAADWSDAPLSCHLVPHNEQALPGVSGPETWALLQVMLVDAETGLVRVLRTVAVDPELAQERAHPGGGGRDQGVRFASGLLFVVTVGTAAMDVGRLHQSDIVPPAFRIVALTYLRRAWRFRRG
jgi:hypothetical protein